jgi:putative spermidine/putrescine transport system substrate-binding protein
MHRRTFIKGAGATIATVGTPLGFPSIVKALNQRPTIRVVGTHVTLQEPLRRRAEQDLGINIEFYPGGSAEVLLKASTNPSSFDLYEQWSNSLKVLWQANAIQPIDIAKLDYWSEINDLTKKGRVSPSANIGLGDAPFKLLYVQDNGEIGATPTGQISFLPYVHNTDSFGYNTAVMPRGTPYESESWGWLLDSRHRGRVAIVNAPTIGIFDLALAAQSKGLMQFADMGNMTRDEIDQLFRIVTDLKRKQHFRGVWSSVPHSVELMASGDVALESMFSPAVSTLNGMNIPCVYAAPREGYRAWHGVMCLSRECSDERRDAAYAYMNWWLSGWPGAFIARQGYYISNPQRSREHMSHAEWDYWYAGKQAAEALRGTDGTVSVTPGDTRSGGSYVKRFENIAVWNTVMDNYEYTLSKWKEFVLA